jgi:hypothetical protein
VSGVLPDPRIVAVILIRWVEKDYLLGFTIISNPKKGGRHGEQNL